MHTHARSLRAADCPQGRQRRCCHATHGAEGATRRGCRPRPLHQPRHTALSLQKHTSSDMRVSSKRQRSPPPASADPVDARAAPRGCAPRSRGPQGGQRPLRALRAPRNQGEGDGSCAARHRWGRPAVPPQPFGPCNLLTTGSAAGVPPCLGGTLVDGADSDASAPVSSAAHAAASRAWGQHMALQGHARGPLETAASPTRQTRKTRAARWTVGRTAVHRGRRDGRGGRARRRTCPASRTPRSARTSTVPRAWTGGHSNFRAEGFTNVNDEDQLHLER